MIQKYFHLCLRNFYIGQVRKIQIIQLLKYVEILGLKKQNELEIAEERDARMRSQYLHPMDVFPQKIDQLLEAIDRVCYNTFIIQFIFIDVVFC